MTEPTAVRGRKKPNPARRYWPWIVAGIAVTILAAGPSVYRLISSSGDSIATSANIFYQFSDQHTTPTEIRQTNIQSWYALYTESIYVKMRDTDGKDIGALQVPPRWSIFLLFDLPTNYRQMIVACVGGQDLKCDVQTSNNRYAIITAIGDVTRATMEISTK